ncbi:molybdopterin biosynthesis protein [Thioflexithrix psekupsensis]|uniref:Molybdopterin molybdenumtransferase n=1 Tax=Thioflexithrix psekupsensis TaxID=1570016 RepID=A0A251X336_9GAMM|nr:molybdopterin biosynthesis protein [Thioflexithrix psekupsensis]OUD11686.1 molybdopterin biosynthesis protein [Thioflexithrix psekupsensis]
MSESPVFPSDAVTQQSQFLQVMDREQALLRFQNALDLRPLGSETVALSEALGRVLAIDYVATVDVPGFDRASVDGFAVQSMDTFGASEAQPVILQLNPEVLSPGIVPNCPVLPGTATPIATGGMSPRGADAIVMIEYTETSDDPRQIHITQAAVPGQFIAFAGSDIARGETALRCGHVLSSREIGILAAIGCDQVTVYRRPQVAIFSTGNELIALGQPWQTGCVFDSNAAILAAAVTEIGGQAHVLGIVPDDEKELQKALSQALQYDMVILSGGTSKGAGDLSYRVVSRLQNPGVIVHGVALKPGKPICLAVTEKKAVVILPGFPTSAIFTFHEFVAPVIRALAGRPVRQTQSIDAQLATRLSSEAGRTEFVMVSLIASDNGFMAFPLGKNSGSVTSFSHADGFVRVESTVETVAAGTPVSVQLIGALEPADLVVIGSHCVGLDYLLSLLQQQGVRVKTLSVGSLGGLAAVKRGECDLAGIHLFDPQSQSYNTPFLTPELRLLPGYRRLQGFVFRIDDARFSGQTKEAALQAALTDPHCLMVNRNAGSGTRILIDQLLGKHRPNGYALQTRSHNAVATAIVQGRADWGVAIESVARQYGLGFIALQDEHYDFVLHESRLSRVQVFSDLLQQATVREWLGGLGFGCVGRFG